MPKLKVYRTAIGFHDAYVAAPSQKAALAAWGADKDLFARGAAEVVSDAALAAEPLAHPGEVIRRSRGSLDEQMRALGPIPRRARSRPEPEADPAPREHSRSKLKPRRAPPPPSRVALEKAEAALAGERAAAEAERAAIREKERALTAERERLEQALRKRAERLESRLDAARESYRAAFAKWSEGAGD